MTRIFDMACLKTERLHLAIFTPLAEVGERWEHLTDDIEGLITETLEEHWASTEDCWERANPYCEDGVDVGTGRTCAVCAGRGELTISEVSKVLQERARALFGQRNFCMICWADCTGMCVDMKEAA